MLYAALNSKWVKFSLGSIALHLAALSAVSTSMLFKPVDLVSNPVIDISYRPELRVSQSRSKEIRPTVSGATHAVESSEPSQDSFVNLRESLHRALDSKLRNRTRSLQLLIALKFSEAGELTSSNIIQSSGLPEIDNEVTQILKTEPIFKSKKLANLKIQVPLHLR